MATHAKLAAAHGELERQAQKLSEVNDQRSRFLSMTSHEFRTPLATISSSAQLLMHSPNGGTVRFAVRQVGDRTLFKVSDEGIGVPQEDLAKLFNLFQRASNVGIIPGTGLGLAIAKSSVDLHGGSISVTSQLGLGTCIEVQL